MWLILIAAAILVFAYIVNFKLDADLLLYLYDFLRPNLKFYKGKTSWVVGASTGIGQSIAFDLARQGSRLILTATSLDKLQENRQKCIELSDGLLKEEDVHIACFDLEDKEQLRHHFEQVINKFGHVDVLFNNAGIGQICPTIDISDDKFDQVLNVNFVSNVRLSQLMAKEWVRTGRSGKIIVTSSIVNYIPFPMLATYAATKRALHGFYNSMRPELVYKGISITLACPGPIRTKMLNNIKKEEFEKRGMIMSADRCARLMLVAGANRLGEVVITNPPQLFIVRLFDHFGGIMNPLMTFLSSEKLNKYFEDLFIDLSKND